VPHVRGEPGREVAQLRHEAGTISPAQS